MREKCIWERVNHEHNTEQIPFQVVKTFAFKHKHWAPSLCLYQVMNIVTVKSVKCLRGDRYWISTESHITRTNVYWRISPKYMAHINDVK